MAFTGAVSPLRNEAIDFIHAEIERVGVDNIDRGAIVKAYMAKGASRARIYGWLKDTIDQVRNPAAPGADPLEEEVARAEGMIAAAGRAAVMAQLPTRADVAKLEREAAAVIAIVREPIRPLSVPDSPPLGETSSGIMPVPAIVAPRPTGIGIVMAKLERAMETVDQCITFAYGENGKLRNPRMALTAADGLRRCLETALKLHEAVDNVQAVQRFMDEIMIALGDVSPEVAAAVVARMQEVTGRWAK